MERRELYEPEDIEQLLFERSYDDLLEEERAFVLRHLSGRAEYEAMRALLLRVHEDEGAAPVPDADPQVREHVLAAFRAEQRPQWRIWLNSIGTAFWPSNASAMWRPALALASIVALVTVGLIGYRSWRGELDRPALAEVKQEQRAEPVPIAPTKRLDAPAEPATTWSADSAPAQQALAQTTTQPATGSTIGSGNATPLFVPPTEDLKSTADATEMEKAEQDGNMRDDMAATIAPPAVEEKPAPVITSGTVTAYDLERNQSRANLDTQEQAGKFKEVAVDRKLKKDADKSVKEEEGTDVTALVGLLRAAW